ncbi:PfkB family carbohydrate kinase [Actinomadura keratinilytica]
MLGSDLAVHPGGKGGNQAVAAARLGARTALLARVGDDAHGRCCSTRSARPAPTPPGCWWAGPPPGSP